MGIFPLPALTCHGFRYFRCFLIAPVSRCPVTSCPLGIATACVQSRSEATRQSPVFYPNREYEIATQKRLAIPYGHDVTDQNTMSGPHFMGVFPLPALTCHGFRYFRCFLIAPLSRCPADILWGFYTIYTIYTVF